MIVSDETVHGNNITLGYNDSYARSKREMIKTEVLRYHGYEIYLHVWHKYIFIS
jgi:hypothetical protein